MQNYTHQHNLIKEDPVRKGIFWGTGCLSGSTRVPLWDGHSKPASKIVGGDMIIAYDQYTGYFGPGIVDSVSVFCANPKPMIELSCEQESITTTYDHPFYDGEAFYPLYQLIWREMEESQRAQLELLCKQYGAHFDCQKTWGKYSCCNEACDRCSRLLAHCNGREDCKGAQSSGDSVAKEPEEVPHSESFRRGQAEQQYIEPGVVHYSVQHVVCGQKQAGEETSTSEREVAHQETALVDSRVLYREYGAKSPYSREEEWLRLSAKEVPTGAEGNTVRNRVWKIKIKESEPYYSIHLTQAPYTYCIGDRYRFVTHNSGKTRTALQLARGRTLVVCPKTQKLDRTWERELDKLDGKHQVDELKVVSKEQFKKEMYSIGHFDTLIGDEAHTLCGVTPNTRFVNKIRVPKASQIFEAMDWYIVNVKPTRVYLVTATPIPQPMAVWGAARLLGIKYDYLQFRAAFFTRVNIRGRELWLPKKDSKSKDTLAGIVQKIGVTGRLEDWFDVPPQTYKIVKVGTTKEQEKKVHELAFLYPDPLVRIGKLHQLEQGIFEGEFIEQNKFEAIDDLYEEFGRVLIFCKYIRQIEELEAYLKAKKIKTLVLTGATKDRRQLMVDAEKATHCVVIAQAQISAGYELPSYRCTVFLSKSYSYVDWDQALGRTLRANNLQRNLYVTIHAGEIDEAVTDSVENKKDFSERIYAETRGFIYNESTEMGEEEPVTPLSDRD